MATGNGYYNYLYALAPGSDVNDPNVPFILVDAGGSLPVNPLASNIYIVDNTESTVGMNDSLTLYVGGVSIGNFTVVGEGNVPLDVTKGPGAGQGVIIADSDGNEYFLTDTEYTGPDKVTSERVVNTSHSILQPECFWVGTKILTPSGNVQIENLKIGDLVLTVDRRVVPVRWVAMRCRGSLPIHCVSYRFG
jgi:hypothetical protein